MQSNEIHVQNEIGGSIKQVNLMLEHNFQICQQTVYFNRRSHFPACTTISLFPLPIQPTGRYAVPLQINLFYLLGMD